MSRGRERGGVLHHKSGRRQGEGPDTRGTLPRLTEGRVGKSRILEPKKRSGIVSLSLAKEKKRNFGPLSDYDLVWGDWGVRGPQSWSQ